MLFNRKNKQAERFPKEKLSQQALDNFAEKYAADEGMTYVLISGKEIKVDTFRILTSKDAMAHFRYLLGQTFLYHDTKNNDYFPLTHLAFTINDDNKVAAWTRDSKVLSQFSTIGAKLGYLPIKKIDDKFLVTKYPGIVAVRYPNDPNIGKNLTSIIERTAEEKKAYATLIIKKYGQWEDFLDKATDKEMEEYITLRKECHDYNEEDAKRLRNLRQEIANHEYRQFGGYKGYIQMIEKVDDTVKNKYGGMENFLKKATAKEVEDYIAVRTKEGGLN